MYHNLMQKRARKRANIDKATIMPIFPADSFPWSDEAPESSDPLLGDETPAGDAGVIEVEWVLRVVEEDEGFLVVKLLELGLSEVNVDDGPVSVGVDDDCDEWEEEVRLEESESPDDVVNGKGGGVGMLGNGGREKESTESSDNALPGLIIRGCIVE